MAAVRTEGDTVIRRKKQEHTRVFMQFDFSMFAMSKSIYFNPIQLVIQILSYPNIITSLLYLKI